MTEILQPLRTIYKPLFCFGCGNHVGSTESLPRDFSKLLLPDGETSIASALATILSVSFELTAEDRLCKLCASLVMEYWEKEARLGELRALLLENYSTALDIKTTMETVEDLPANDVEEKSQEEENETEVIHVETLSEGEMNAGGGAIELDEVQYEEIDETMDELVLKEAPEAEAGTKHEFDQVVEVEVGSLDFLRMDEDDAEEEGIKDAIELTISNPETSFRQEGDTFFCLRCPVETAHDCRLISLHLKLQHSAQTFVCELCGFVSRDRRQHQSHFGQGHKEGPFSCFFCPKSFAELIPFRRHLRTHAAMKRAFVCLKCDRRMLSRNLLAQHENTHMGARPFECSECGKTFASKYTLMSHGKTHNENRPRPHTCEICFKTFLEATVLNRHRETHAAERTHECSVCGKSFATARNLSMHAVVHAETKRFECPVCQKRFARRVEVVNHIRTHTKERPFKCDLCDRSFSQQSNLLSHKRLIHLNDRRYACECGQSFKRRRLLDYHVRSVHTGERPFQCSQCPSAFVCSDHLRKHLRIHSGVRGFACEICQRPFRTAENRNAHRFTHIDRKPFECGDCGLGFMRKAMLLGHIKEAGHSSEKIVMNAFEGGESGGEQEAQSEGDVVFGKLEETETEVIQEVGDDKFNIIMVENVEK